MPGTALSRLVATKTQRPKLPPGLVRRDRLFALIDQVRPRRLTVIKAASGFGKTSLALVWADHLAREGERVAWVSVDAEDDEPGQFLLYLAAALRSACPEIDDRVVNLIDEVALIRPLDVVRLLINALADIDDALYLFLDDYHLLRDPGVGECTAYLLRRAPSQLHVVLTTRTEPDLPLARLRAQDELLEIDASALRFDLEETRRFLEQEASGMASPAAASALHEKTEGWPVMLRIVATTAQQSGRDLATYLRQLSARHRPIRSHLLEMLDGLSGDAVALLLETSILDSLCAPLCRAVADVEAAEAVFESLVSRQLLLTPLDANGVWFRCHPLLRSFLQQRLETEFPETLPELHRRAYAWYAGEQRWTDAIRHAIAVGEPGEAVKWIEKCAMALLKRGELRTLLAWERSVAPELIRVHAKGRLAIAWGMALAMRFDEAQRLATQIEADLGPATPQAREALGCECQTIRAVALALSDDVDAALGLAEDSLRRRSSGRWTTNVATNVALIGLWKRGELERCYTLPWLSAPGDDPGRNVMATVYRLCILGMLEYDQLHEATASRHFQAALLVAREHAGPNSASAAQPASLVARLSYDRGSWDDAEAMLADRMPTIDAVCMLDCVLHAYTAAVRIAAYRGRRERVEELLEQALELSRARRWLRLETMVLRERTRAALLVADVGQAERHVARLRAVAASSPASAPSLQAGLRDDLGLAEALLHLGCSRLDAARELLDGMAATARARRTKRLELECAAARAATLAGSAPNPAGLSALASALRLAGSSRLVQILADWLVFAPRDLAADLRRIDAPPALARALDAIRTVPGSPHPPPRTQADVLSPREQAILSLVAQGRGNKDVARELNVAPETVKTHMKRIFQKMQVSTRSEAISKFVQR